MSLCLSRRRSASMLQRRSLVSLAALLVAAAACGGDAGRSYATVADLARAAGCQDLPEVRPDGRNACHVDGPEYEFVVGHESRMKALEPLFDAYCSSTEDTAAGVPEFAYIRGANWLIFTGEDFGSRDALERIAHRTGGRVVSPC